MEDLPPKFDFDIFLQKYRYHFLVILLGLILIAGGVFFYKNFSNFSQTRVEILETSGGGENGKEITAEIAGAVITPGVYKIKSGARIDDILIAAGGFSADADRVWTDKYLNRASVLEDGQKVYIPSTNKQSNGQSANFNTVYQTTSSDFSSDSTTLVNINTSSLSELDTLPGIGPKYAQSIIEHRPYSKTEDLVASGAITQTLYEKIKNSITVY